MIDEQTEELAALYVLGLLGGHEQVAFETALARDPELQHLTDGLRETAAGLAQLAAAGPPPPAVRARVLASVTSAAPALPDQAPVFLLPAWLGWSVAACLALAVSLLVRDNSALSDERQRLLERQALAQETSASLKNLLEAERILSRAQLDQLRIAQQTTDVAQLKIAALASLLSNSPAAQAIAVWNPATQEGVLDVSSLPALATDQDYQLWVVDPQYANPVDAGVFQVEPTSGGKHFIFKPRQPVRTAAKFAVSRERKGGVPKAEGPMVLLSN